MTNTMKTILHAAVCVLALAPAAVMAGIKPAPVDKNPVPAPSDPCAGPISYSNVELLYEYTDFDDRGLAHGDGVVLRYEYEAMKQFYLTADVDYNSYDFTPEFVTGQFGRSFNVDEWKLSVGIGGHIALTENIHLAGDAGFVYSDVSADFNGAVPGGDRFDDSDTGWFIRPHIRAKWGCLTLHAGASYYDLGGDNDGWTGYGRLYYQITPSLDLTAGASFGEEADVYSAGVRWRF
jgi:hypothetical protein